MGAGPAERRLDLRRLRVRARARVGRGLRRWRTDAWGIVTAALAAGGAYAIALLVVGNPIPLFAAIAAFVSLGYGTDRRPRKVAELAAGVTLGVAFGEAFAAVFGSGPVQVGVVLLLAVSMARLTDSAQMLAMQAGVQSVVIVVLSGTQLGAGFLRWLDALIGGAVALLVAVLLPLDVRRRAHALARAGMEEVAATTGDVARGIRTADERLIDDALTRARGSQGVIDEWHKVVRDQLASTRFTPTPLRHDDTLARLERAAVLCDRAMRNTRVIARRAWTVAQSLDDAAEVADLLTVISEATRQIGESLGSSSDLIRVRPQLIEVAGRLDPAAFSGWQAQTLVVLVRSLVVDLLELTGMTGAQARELLVDLGPTR